MRMPEHAGRTPVSDALLSAGLYSVRPTAEFDAGA